MFNTNIWGSVNEVIYGGLQICNENQGVEKEGVKLSLCLWRMRAFRAGLKNSSLVGGYLPFQILCYRKGQGTNNLKKDKLKNNSYKVYN